MIFGAPYPPPLTHADAGRLDAWLSFAWLPVRLSDGQYVWLERYATVRRVEFIVFLDGEPLYSWGSPKRLHMGQYTQWLRDTPGRSEVAA